MIRMSGTTDPNSASGQICFLNKKSQVDHFQFVNDNTALGLYEKTKDNLEISLFQMNLRNGKEVYICHVYNHPNHPRRQFWQEFKQFLRENLQLDENKKIKSNLFVLGDFNIDADDENTYYIDKLQQKLGLTFLHTEITTDRGTCIDWCLTNTESNSIQYECTVYESFYSDHKPIILAIKNE
jgi:exonuclease III